MTILNYLFHIEGQPRYTLQFYNKNSLQMMDLVLLFHHWYLVCMQQLNKLNVCSD